MASTDLGPILDTLREEAGRRSSPCCRRCRRHLGYLPPEVLGTVARHARVPRSRVYGVASFYSQFRFNPVGRHRVAVCRGTACHVSGARLILEELERTLGIAEGQTTEDMEYSLETVACIGCCGLSPCISVNDEVSAKLTPKKVRKLFKKAKEAPRNDGELRAASADGARGVGSPHAGDTPVVLVGTATCGRSAGALDTLSALREEMAGHGLECRFVEVGCLGPCYAEPLVTVHRPGEATVCFASVDKQGARRIAAYLAGGDLPDEARVRHDGTRADPRHPGPDGHAHDEGAGPAGSPELRRRRSRPTSTTAWPGARTPDCSGRSSSIATR